MSLRYALTVDDAVAENQRRLWAKKVQPELIRRLYLDEAWGLLTDELLDKVGWALWERCESILTVSSERVRCPECRQVFSTTWRSGGLPDAVNTCPGCGWAITNQSWHERWRHRHLRAGDAGPIFRAFVDEFPRLRRAADKMLAIDRLIHGFHQELRYDGPNRSAANNLIEGSHDQILAMLDELASGESTPPERQLLREQWQVDVSRLRRRSKTADPESVWARRRMDCGNADVATRPSRLRPCSFVPGTRSRVSSSAERM